MWSLPLSALGKSLIHASIKWRLDSWNVKRQHGLWIFVILRPKCCIRTQVQSLNTFVQNNPVDRVSSKLPCCVSFLFLTLNLIWNWWQGAVHKWLHHFFVRVNGEKNYFATKQRKLGRWWLSSQFKCSLCVKVWYDLWNVFKIGGLPKISPKSPQTQLNNSNVKMNKASQLNRARTPNASGHPCQCRAVLQEAYLALIKTCFCKHRICQQSRK